ncbi:hypothetical protein Y032_0032g2611 [Ancylostoma ceylanicum]|uniref:Uncharacterized protein n=1 Tax=Ancylostoma ceylanicum TaxID=53326 RepID=A0A016UR91_9BILA|nr:hypothetical protein Y032_0032g2611 [Ancylostoma ceylanicum]
MKTVRIALTATISARAAVPRKTHFHRSHHDRNVCSSRNFHAAATQPSGKAAAWRHAAFFSHGATQQLCDWVAWRLRGSFCYCRRLDCGDHENGCWARFRGLVHRTSYAVRARQHSTSTALSHVA